MNYIEIYNRIIENRRNNPFIGYTEEHHILPRSLGGTDENYNLVSLSAKEHFICHLLLTKIYTDKYKHSKMVRAFMMMMVESSNHDRYVSSRVYQKQREDYSKICSERMQGSNNTQFGTRWVSNVVNGTSLKIKKQSPLPVNCVEGRNKKMILCDTCKCRFIGNVSEKYCSSTCKPKRKAERKYKHGFGVEVNGVNYKSISHAADCLGVGHETARMRFKSKNFPNWIIISSDRC